MHDYRVYSFNGRNRIAAADWIQAENDLQAIGLVHATKQAVRCEIWHGQRLVAEVPAYTVPDPTGLSGQMPQLVRRQV